MTNKEFLEKIKEGCIEGWRQYKVLPSLTAAQAILESGWGKHAPHNALFGIKADLSWKGKKFNAKTYEEYHPGEFTEIVDAFRGYDSWEESILDHGKFLNENSRYKDVIEETDYVKACKKIQEAGYATASNYSNLLIILIRENKLYEWDQEGDIMRSTSKTLKETTAHIRSHLNQMVDVDGVWGSQCVDTVLLWSYYTMGIALMGNAVDIPNSGRAAGLQWIPNTFTPGVNVQEGDIVCYSTSAHRFGHVGYVVEGGEETFTTLETNVDGGAQSLTTGGPMRLCKRRYVGDGMTVTGWLRINYAKATAQPTTSTTGFKKVKDERATMTVTVNSLNVRNAPSLTGQVVAQYKQGSKINYDSVYEGDGYRWISYVSTSGVRRYVACRDKNGNPYGTFK